MQKAGNAESRTDADGVVALWLHKRREFVLMRIESAREAGRARRANAKNSCKRHFSPPSTRSLPSVLPVPPAAVAAAAAAP